jgi:fatty acid kinase fatty acid binding subunit
MTQVRVVTDSASDLDRDTVERLGIEVVPMTVLFGRDAYPQSEISSDEFWDKVAAGMHPGTSQPSVGLFEQTFSRIVETGHHVLCLTVTSKHSGTFGNAQSAARRFGDRVKVMDSLSLSLGEGFQVLAAARAAFEGLDLRQVAQVVDRVRERTRVFILLDTIEHLRRGGRADAFIPILNRVTKVLKIKPLLHMADGSLGLQGLARSYERGLRQIEQEVVKLSPLGQLAVMHTRCADVARDLAHSLAEKLGLYDRQVLIAEAGPVLSVHAGPGVVGVGAVQQTAGWVADACARINYRKEDQ